MVNEKLKRIFFFAIILFIAHAVEEYFTGFYNFDQLLFKPLGEIFPFGSQAAFIVFQVVFVLLSIKSYRLKTKRNFLLIISTFWGIILVLELEHLYQALSLAKYTPGLVTSLLFPIISFFYWRELLKNSIALKSLLFAVEVIILALIAFWQITTRVDRIFVFANFQSFITTVVGIILISIGGLLRFWSALLFYRHRIKVVSVYSQGKLITSGPFKFSRNPLYLGIICISFGSAMFFGSISGVIIAILIFIGWDLWVRLREEKQLEQHFGEQYLRYKKLTPRWLLK